MIPTMSSWITLLQDRIRGLHLHFHSTSSLLQFLKLLYTKLMKFLKCEVSSLRNLGHSLWITLLNLLNQTRGSLHHYLQAIHAALRQLFTQSKLSSVAQFCMARSFSMFTMLCNGFIQLIRKAYNLANWMFLPRMFFRILIRHIIALIILFIAHVLLKLALQLFRDHIAAHIRKFFFTPAYLKRETTLQQRLLNCVTYSQWKQVANALDHLQGKYAWKEKNRSHLYDWRRIRDDLKVYRRLVDEQDVKGIMQFSRSRLVRNLVGINNPQLYVHLRAGTKRLIEEYITEVVRALQLVCIIDTEGVSLAEKLTFFTETRHAFGRSALLLSGGATLGMYHVGVIKALHECQLLPRVMSGASVGALIVSLFGTRTDDEITDLLNIHEVAPGVPISLEFFPKPSNGWEKLNRLWGTGAMLDVTKLEECVRQNIPDFTFQEAYDHSGRIINIVVSPSISGGNLDSLRLLNYITAPNVLVWSAILASCAIPGIYPSVELMCKDEYGQTRKYMEGPVKWEDGSVQADLPMQKLSELFNISFYIVSQTNPHIVPFLSSISSSATPFSRIMDVISAHVKGSLLTLTQIFPLPASFRFVLDQKYAGHITIVPRVQLRDYGHLLDNPTILKLEDCTRVSEVETWELMAAIRGACEIEFCLDESVRRMRGLIVEELSLEPDSIERNPTKLSRIRSYSTDFLSNSNTYRLRGSPAMNRHIIPDEPDDFQEDIGAEVDVDDGSKPTMMKRRISLPARFAPLPQSQLRTSASLAQVAEPLLLPSTKSERPLRIGGISKASGRDILTHLSNAENATQAYAIASKLMRSSSRAYAGSTSNSSTPIQRRNSLRSSPRQNGRSRTPPAGSHSEKLPTMALIRQLSEQNSSTASPAGNILSQSSSPSSKTYNAAELVQFLPEGMASTPDGSGFSNSTSSSVETSPRHDSNITLNRSLSSLKNLRQSSSLMSFIPRFRSTEPRQMSSLALAMLDHDDSGDDEVMIEDSYSPFPPELKIQEIDEEEPFHSRHSTQPLAVQTYSHDLRKPRLQFRSVSENPSGMKRHASSASVSSPKSSLRPVQSNTELSSR